MTNYPIPENERERQEDLYRYAILDTPPEECFDHLTRLAAHICEVPIALISLIDRDRVWVKSWVGLEAKQASRGDSFCAHTIIGSDVLLVEDATVDPRFAQHPHVIGEPGIRFYAGAAFQTPHGTALGSLCVVDLRPRTLTAAQIQMLQILASQVGQQLEMRRVGRQLHRQSRLLDKSQQTAQIGGWELDLQTKVLSWTNETFRIHGVSATEYVPTFESAIDWYAPTSHPSLRAAIETTLAGGPAYELELQIVKKGGAISWVRTTGECEEDAGGARRLFGIFQDITERRQLETEILLVAQREQTRIGFDLHDGLGQELTGIGFLLHVLAAKLPPSLTEAHQECDEIEQLVRDAIGTCRTLAHGLYPAARERGGLIQALRTLAHRSAKTYGIPVFVETQGDDSLFSDFMADHVYRIAQEAMTNAHRHATPGKITISLDITAAGARFSITDNGTGVGAMGHTEGIGLQIIRYRARLIGATVTIGAGAAGGTCVQCHITAAAVTDCRPTFQRSHSF